jgi:hypothetical protein
MHHFTDEELLAYADEQLASDRCTLIEQLLRDDRTFVMRLNLLLSHRDQGDHTIGNVWRSQQLSCPSRDVWAAFVEGRLSDGLSQYLRFHLGTVGCRVCAANLADLERSESLGNIERRTQKIFQSSAGHLR